MSSDEPTHVEPAAAEPSDVVVRVWAEEREGNTLLLTWEWPSGADAGRDRGADGRAAAATIGVRPGVLTAESTSAGVEVTYDPELISKAELAAALRAALALDSDLKTRGNELLKRAPTYARLAKSLALDERVSPVPQAARDAAQARRTSAPLRMVPGFSLISQLPTLIPVLRSLSTWSRTAPPGVVDEHLGAHNLTRETLDRDLATAHEMLAFARAYTTEMAGKAARKATSLATQATGAAHDWLQKRNERNPPS
jgi:hypothetical protein